MMDNDGKVKGGKARAAALTAGQRKVIAKKAAIARWNPNIPKATHSGELSIGDVKISCYVLEDGQRILSTRGIMKSLGRTWRGRKYTGTELPVFIEAKNLKPFIPNNLDVVPKKFKTDKGTISEGYGAEMLPGICEIYLSARDTRSVLTAGQQPIAKQCEILVRSLSRVGVIALVDEATGYQEVRDRKALQIILDKYITDEWAKWTKTFPDDFYKHLFRLKGIPYPPGDGGRKPSYVGHWTNDIVYSRLAPGVLDALKKKNPRLATGGRKHKYHQSLTRDYGHPALTEHISNVVFLMAGCTDWDDFKRRLNTAKQKYGKTIEMDV